MSKRIDFLSDLVDKGCNLIIDVGSDHAQFAINVLSKRGAKHVINIEKNNGPLTSGITNLSNSELIDKTTNVLGDGFSNFKCDKLVDLVNVSGLGGKLICEIITNNNLAIKKYLLCPNNNEVAIREWAKLNNYHIEIETAVEENDIIYHVFLIDTHAPFDNYDEYEIEFGARQFFSENKLLRKKLEASLIHIKDKGLDKLNPQLHKYAERIMVYLNENK